MSNPINNHTNTHNQPNSGCCYCIRLRKSANAITKFYDDSLKKVGLTINQYFLLINLSRLHTATITKLADILRLDRTTITRNLKPLFEAGLVQDAAEPGERNRKIQLTESGKEAIKACYGYWLEAQHKIEEKIGLEGLNSFINTLDLLEHIDS